MSTVETDFDVVIVGGGMVGATLACALADSPLRVALIEAQAPQFEWPANGFDLRVSALTRATQHIFEALKVWRAMVDQRVSPFREMHVWDAGGKGAIHFDSAEIGEPYLGHIVENRVILAALYARLEAVANVELMSSTRLKRLDLDGEYASVTTESGRTLSAELLVAADGSRSWVRQQAHISVRGWDYNQEAIVTYVKTERYHKQTAWQRFLPEGPLAFLPLSNGFSSIVWSTSPVHAQNLLAMDDVAFAEALSSSFEHTLGTVAEVGPRASYPLRFFDAQSYVGNHLALVGDAAHTMHPLAGQGVNLGLADVASLAEIIIETQRGSQSIGAAGTLRRYERWRRSENTAVLATVNGFQRLFGSRSPVIRWLRSSGMNFTHGLSPVRNLIMRQAMGMTADQPTLSRGIKL